jgi:hypothetical protein
LEAFNGSFIGKRNCQKLLLRKMLGKVCPIVNEIQ